MTGFSSWTGSRIGLVLELSWFPSFAEVLEFQLFLEYDHYSRTADSRVWPKTREHLLFSREHLMFNLRLIYMDSRTLPKKSRSVLIELEIHSKP